MTENFAKMVLHSGINDFFRFKNDCPKYWAGKAEEKIWNLGWNHAKNLCKK